MWCTAESSAPSDLEGLPAARARTRDPDRVADSRIRVRHWIRAGAGDGMSATEHRIKGIAGHQMKIKHITSKGHKLANDLKVFGITQHVLEVCSLLARHAVTHHRLQEIQCNREATAAELLQEKHIERRIVELVSELPEAPTGKATVKFSGDPRGYTVKIVIPGMPGNTFGGGGEYGI